MKRKISPNLPPMDDGVEKIELERGGRPRLPDSLIPPANIPEPPPATPENTKEAQNGKTGK